MSRQPPADNKRATRHPTQRQKQADAQARFDRMALAFLNGVLGLLSAGLVWLLLFMVGGRLRIGTLLLSPAAFWLVLGFAAAMAGLGYARRDNLLLDIYGKIWQWLYRIYQALH